MHRTSDLQMRAPALGLPEGTPPTVWRSSMPAGPFITLPDRPTESQLRRLAALALPEYLKIRRMATPKNHRSPPLGLDIVSVHH